MAISKSPLASDPAHLRAAFADLGLKEKPGKESAERIDAMFHDSGNPGKWDDSETAWCAAAMGAWLHDAGLQGTGSLAARSYMSFGAPVDSPRRGDIAVFKRGNSSWQGHVAFYLGRDKGRVWVIGGNQSNAVTVASYPETSLLGYRRVPASIPQPEPKEAPVAKVVTILRRGAKGPRVTTLQQQLAVLGHNPGAIDGEFGSLTDRAVKDFQERMGLKVDGEVGPHTAAAIEEMLAKAARTTPRPKPVEYTPTDARPIPTPQELPPAPDAPRGGAGGVLAILLVLAGLAAAAVWTILGGAP